jgi:hypothetical protein
MRDAALAVYSMGLAVAAFIFFLLGGGISPSSFSDVWESLSLLCLGMVVGAQGWELLRSRLGGEGR